MKKLDNIYNEYVNLIANESNASIVLKMKNDYLNHEEISSLYDLISKSTDNHEKGRVIGVIKEFKQNVENAANNRIEQLKSREHVIDVSLPTLDVIGSLHPMTLTINEIRTVISNMSFEGMKFQFRESPEIETAFNNFDALNIPALHPCRTDHQSFHINDEYILRTHTTSTTSRVIQENANDDGAYFTIGKTYRRDSDATHVPMFHQWEILVIHENANFPALLTFLKTFLNAFFGKQLKYRFRPSFFPFTRFSTEVDIWFNDRWLEVLGCGIIAPEVFDACKSKSRMAFAVGGGVERLCMIKNGIKDIRSLYGDAIMNGFTRFGGNR